MARARARGQTIGGHGSDRTEVKERMPHDSCCHQFSCCLRATARGRTDRAHPRLAPTRPGSPRPDVKLESIPGPATFLLNRARRFSSTSGASFGRAARRAPWAANSVLCLTQRVDGSSDEGTNRRKNSSRSRRTSGSAFSWTQSEHWGSIRRRRWRCRAQSGIGRAALADLR